MNRLRWRKLFEPPRPDAPFPLWMIFPVIFAALYATHFTLWDRLMGTLHPEHDAELKRNVALTAAARRGETLPAE